MTRELVTPLTASAFQRPVIRDGYSDVFATWSRNASREWDTLRYYEMPTESLRTTCCNATLTHVLPARRNPRAGKSGPYGLWHALLGRLTICYPADAAEAMQRLQSQVSFVLTTSDIHADICPNPALILPITDPAAPITGMRVCTRADDHESHLWCARFEGAVWRCQGWSRQSSPTPTPTHGWGI